jgi:hypothetical protein
MPVIIDVKSGQLAVAGGGDVIIDIEFANAQPSSWNAKLQGEPKPKTGKGDDSVNLGAGAPLKGRVLQIVGFMTDANPATNRLVHRVTVRQGTNTVELKFGDEGPEPPPGESAVYTSLILFS